MVDIVSGKRAVQALRLLAARFLNKRFPFAVSWHLTYRCNYNCAYCGIQKAGSDNEISCADVFSVIDGLSELGAARIHFCGGESLIREDFSSIVDYCHEKSIETGLISNGALVPRYASRLKNLAVLKLSFDGPAEVQDKLRGEGAYERVMNAVEAARQQGINVVFNCTLTNLNLGHLEFIISTSKNLGIPVKFSPLNYIHAGSKDIEGLIPEPFLYKKGLSYIKKQARKNKFILNSESSLRYISFFPQGERFRNCVAGKIFCHIKPDGKVYPCERAYAGGVFNCKTDGIKKAFYSLAQLSCNECWCTGTLELNLVYSLDASALMKVCAGKL